MTTTDIQTFLVLSERARQAGLIQFNEMPAVLQAVEAGKKAIEAAQVNAQTEGGTPAEASAKTLPQGAKK